MEFIRTGKCLLFCGPMKSLRGWRDALCILAVTVLLGMLPALGLINLKFTPTDLVRTSAQVLLLKVSFPKDNVMQAEVLETLRGTAPAEKKMNLHLDPTEGPAADDFKSAFMGEPTAAAVLTLRPVENIDLAQDPLGALQIGTQWFAVFKKDAKLVLNPDKQELGTVWAGSARMLAAAARYVESDPTAGFPVMAGMVWGSDLNLGKLAGRAHQCLVADLGEGIGMCVIFFADGGDRVYRIASKGEKPVDITARVKLTTASRVATLADMDGDGRVDVVSWNGKALTVAAQAADGTFAAAKTIVPSMADCLSLDAIDAGAKAGSGLVVGTAEEPVLVVPDGAGAFTTRALAGGAAKDVIRGLGAGGFCVTADFDRDGRCDVIQIFPQGLLTYAGEGAGRFKAPVKTAVKFDIQASAAVCGDYDTDGMLDMVVGAPGRLTVLTREETKQWQDQTFTTGELAYHGNANQPKIVGVSASDINCDGRQGVSLFHSDRKPMSFFNRGFACFGWARELDVAGAGAAAGGPGMEVTDATAPPKPPLKAAGALQQGQTAGATCDLNGDGIMDMIAVDAAGQEVWVLLGENQESVQPRTVAVALAPTATGPVVVSVREQNRCTGMYVVRPGVPAFISRPRAGALTLEWTDAEGKPATRKVMAVKEFVRVAIP